MRRHMLLHLHSAAANVFTKSPKVVPAHCRFFFQAEDGIRGRTVTGVQTCALPIFIGGLEGVFTYLRDYPYACWEQKLTKGVMAAHYRALTAYLDKNFQWPESQDLPERSEEHTSELQSPYDLVCRLLLEKKKDTTKLQIGGCDRKITAEFLSELYPVLRYAALPVRRIWRRWF